MIRSQDRCNKSLPPIPPSEPEKDQFNDHLSNSASLTDALISPARSSTFILAQAALGISLPPVLPRGSMSSSTSEVNTVELGSKDGEKNDLRRSKSSRKIKPPTTTPSARPSEDGRPIWRRSRVMSLGTSSFLNQMQADTKGKGAQQDSAALSTPMKTISRRASFWSRKKIPTTGIPILRHKGSHESLFVPLPLVESGQPFLVEHHIPPISSNSPSPPRAHARGVSRSHSARAIGISRRMSQNEDTATSPPPPPPPLPVPAETALSNHAFFPRSESPSDMTIPAPYPSPQPAKVPRARSQTNPPLLQRLSLNIFSSSPATNSPSASTLESAMPSPLAGSQSARPSLAKEVEHLKPNPGAETPDIFVERVSSAVGKAEVATILASGSTDFYLAALRTYMSRFDFLNDPLDIAVRRFLMHVGLPRETQQIDRVVEAFAHRYSECNPNIFLSDDHPYIMAFSLIMLHTDAFNKSNKRKMSKQDYIKNASLPGVSAEVLDYFYDNIVFAPFIFVEDALSELAGKQNLETPSRSSNASGSSNSTLLKSPRVDPYYLISHNLLGQFRVNVEANVPLLNPFSYQGTNGPWDEVMLQRNFATGIRLELGSEESAPSSTFSLSGVGAPSSPAVAVFNSSSSAISSSKSTSTIRVVKTGMLNKKEDTLEGGKKVSNRKWRTLSVLLTTSQLLFFRDPSWVKLLTAAPLSASSAQPEVFKPDEIVPLRDAVAVFDTSYTKRVHTFRLVLPRGRHMLLEANSEDDLNEWIAHVNYASAFKTSNLRIRPQLLSGKDVQLTGVAAATSHLHDLQYSQRLAPTTVHQWGPDTSTELMGMLSPPPVESPTKFEPHTINAPPRTTLDLDTIPVAESNDADQFKMTFDLVKADLAAGKTALVEDSTSEHLRSPFSSSPAASSVEDVNFATRSQTLHLKIHELETEMTTAQAELDSKMQFIHHLAILTPFQRSTRDRIQTAMQSVSKKVEATRLSISKLACHREVLSADLAAEERDWSKVKRDALRAAQETLLSQRSSSSLALAQFTETPLSSSVMSDSQESMHVRPTSNAESFYSALDVGMDWPGDVGSSNGFDDSPGSTADLDISTSVSDRARDAGIEGRRLTNHEKFYTAQEMPDEEAEEWSKTRCAQRVSLVRVPSGLVAMASRMEHG